jgi:hypothetical protein
MNPVLLMPDRLHRIQPNGLTRWQPAGKHSRRGQYQTDNSEDNRPMPARTKDGSVFISPATSATAPKPSVKPAITCMTPRVDRHGPQRHPQVPILQDFAPMFSSSERRPHIKRISMRHRDALFVEFAHRVRRLID